MTEDDIPKFPWKIGQTTFPYPKNIKNFIKEIFPLYIQCIREEDSDSVLYVIDYFCQQLRVLGPASINDLMEDLVESINLFLQEKVVSTQTADPKDIETNNIATKQKFASDVIIILIGVLAELWGDKFVEVFKSILPNLCHFGRQSQHAHNQTLAIGCIADVATTFFNVQCDNNNNNDDNDDNNNNKKKKKKNNNKKQNKLMSQFSDVCYELAFRTARSSDANLRQNALFAIGALFLTCDHNINKQYCQQSLRCVQMYLQLKKDGDFYDQLVRDNAVSAFGKMMISEPKLIPLQQNIPIFVNALPLTADFSENKMVYDILMKLVLDHSQYSNEYIKQILTLIGDILPTDKVNETTKEKNCHFFKKYLFK